MPRAFIPPTLRALTNGQAEIDVPGGTVREVVESLEARFPGMRDRLCNNHGLRPGLIVAVGSTVATTGLRAKVAPNDEVHFLPALGGG